MNDDAGPGRRPDRSTRSGPPGWTTAIRVVGAVLVAAAWVALVRGLFLLPVSDDPQLDLEAGPGFAVFVSVVLPTAVLTLVLLVALPFAAAVRRGAVIGAAAATAVIAFIAWVLTCRPLLDYVPDLRAALWLAAGLAGAGLVTCAVAWVGPSTDARAATAAVDAGGGPPA